MKIVTPAQMRNIDKTAVDMGVPSILLMENAASAVVCELPVNAESFLVVCGTGNNGGDGYAIARQLYAGGKCVDILAAGLPKTEDSITNYNIAKSIGIPFVAIDGLGEYDVIVDALLGTGISGEVRQPERQIIDYINKTDSYVCCVDIPSGTDAKSGLPCGISVKADKTVTFCCVKQGQMWSSNIGKLVVKSISIPKQSVERENITTESISREYVKSIIPDRSTDAHKGSCGKILAVAGSEGMTGAAKLCCEAALRCGSGLLKLAIPRSLNIAMESVLTEAMTIPVAEYEGAICENAADTVISHIKKSDALVIGCGLSVTDETKKAFNKIVESCDIPMVIDADGINILSENIDLIKGKTVVLTPHPVEFSRLTGLTLDEIYADRVKAAADFAAEYGAVTLLKGQGTVVALPNGKAYINATGNQGMATGGSGDVLAGIIVSLMGQGLCAADAAIAGVYLHGLSGDVAKEYKGIYSMLPTDIINCIGEAIDIVKGVM